MITGVFSDVHGNYQALKAVLADGHRLGVERWYCLGDVAFKGPEPEECIEAVMSLGQDVAIMGNTEEWLPTGPGPGEGSTPEIRAMVRAWWDWAIVRLSPEHLDWVRALPRQREIPAATGIMLMTHATTRGLEDGVAPWSSDAVMQEAFQTSRYSTVACGHIHVPYLRRVAGTTVFNTGSVGRPVDGDTRASYVILTTDEQSDIAGKHIAGKHIAGKHIAGNGRSTGLGIQFRRVPYDLEKAVRIAEERCFPRHELFAAAIRAGQSF